MPTDIKVYFVLFMHLRDELSTSEEMQQAFELCRQNQMTPEWIAEAQCIEFGFKKKDIVVFDTFEGETYKKIQTTKCLSIVGPWCITTCLLEGLPIPNNNSPVYNMAMYKLNITASNYTIDHKKRIKEKVELMGGVYSLHITNSLTHLITNSIRTEKYTVAREKHLPIMLESWVEDVWNVHQTRHVKATDDEFLKHKCPTFQGLNASCTGFTVDERAKLQRVLVDTGGKFTGKMVVGHTDVLICNPGINSEKFTAALKAKIPCVRKEWIYDSYEKGYPLPQQNYSIKLSSSTPTKIAPLNMDFSMMSVISSESMNPLKTSISDTLQPDISLYNPPTSQKKQKENKIPDHIDTIDLKQVKQAGAFLDGCSVYLVGFSPEKREKLNRILKSAGATRYDDISDRVTQILVGDPNSHEVKVLNAKGCGLPMVSSEWIIECIKSQQPVNEEPFIVRTSSSSKPAPSSPLSKKGLTLLQCNTAVDESEHSPEAEPYRDESVMMYMSKNQAEEEEDTLAQLLAQGNIDSKIGNNSESKDTTIRKEETVKQIEEKLRESTDKSSTMQEDDTGLSTFEDKTFKIMNFADEELERLTTIIEFLNGEVVNASYKGITDYAVVPTLSKQIRHTSTEVVNDLWVLECHTMKELLEVQYYHQPFYSKTNAKPLENCIITISGYTSFERSYLTTLLEHLGAIYQDKFARITLADKSVRASTHLICLEPSSSKYSAALRWHRPAISHHWLIECAEKGVKVDEKSYLLNKNQEISVLIETTKPEKSNQSKPETPVLSNKRDVKGKKISPVQPKEPDTENADLPETFGKKFKFVKADKQPEEKRPELEESPFKGFESQKEKAPTEVPVASAQTKIPAGEADPIITLDNGTALPLSKFMKDLRDQGVFDTPSPVHKLQTGTPFGEIINRLRRDGHLPAKRTSVKHTLSDEQPGFSQGTPVGKYIRGLQERNVLPSSPQNLNITDSPLPKTYYDVNTPDTPLGQFLEDNPSKETRKRWQQYLDKIPQYNVHDRTPTERRLSTPWNEIKKQTWSWLLRKDQPDLNPNLVKNLSDALSDESLEIVQPKEVVKQAPVETESQIEISNHIGQLQDMLKRRDSSGSSRNSLFRLDGTTPQKPDQVDEPAKDTLLRDAKDSQADAVGWDEPMESISAEQTSTEDTNEYRLRKFMVSGIEQVARNSCYSTIKSLGGDVSELTYYDPSATHLICSTPTRNEKILSSMAAGKFIIHISYIQDSGEAGRFLEEELYEFGNAKSATRLNDLVKTSFSIDSMHWWRMRVCEKEQGAFAGIRALVFSKNKPALVRVIEAGGGTIVNASPPYTHNIDVTHCFVDPKMKNSADFVPLAEQGVPCLNALYLSNYLNNRTSVQIEEFILPALQSYYS